MQCTLSQPALPALRTSHPPPSMPVADKIELIGRYIRETRELESIKKSSKPSSPPTLATFSTTSTSWHCEPPAARAWCLGLVRKSPSIRKVARAGSARTRKGLEEKSAMQGPSVFPCFSPSPPLHHKAQSTKHKAQSTKHKAQSTKHQADPWSRSTHIQTTQTPWPIVSARRLTYHRF